jgi:hypothetical protein
VAKVFTLLLAVRTFSKSCMTYAQRAEKAMQNDTKIAAKNAATQGICQNSSGII